MARNSLKSVMRLIDEANRDVPVEESFISDLKRSIELTDSKNKRKPSMTYKPSSMKCIRNMYYQVSGAEPDSSTSEHCIIGICNSGTDIHIRIQDAVSDMKNNGFDCEYVNVADYVKSRNLDYLDIVEQSGNETKLYHKGLNISFMCDGIIKYRGKYYIIEFKTENSFKFATRTGVDESHIAQGTTYSMAFNIDKVIFVYISRDNLDKKAFMLNVTEGMKKQIIDKIEECDMYVNSNTVPPKPEKLPKNTCTYCNYKSMCKKE